MKTTINFRFIFLVFASIIFWNFNIQKTYGQDAQKNAVRIKADYIKTMNKEAVLNIRASSKIDRQNVDVSNIDLTITNEINDDEVNIGTTTTNEKGESKFIISNLGMIKPDSTGLYNINISFKGNDLYKRSSKSLSFRDATIEAKIITIDSINYVTATLKDTAKDSVLSDQILNVQVQRLFKSLKIGKDFNSTDESGTILVSIPEGIPGVDGILTFEIVLKDSDEYGTVKAMVNAPLGVPVVDESTYDQRTLWSPRNKTPLFLLIVPNLFILGIWGLILYLIINLYKISKSKI
jgi:hypothetical protein